MPEPRIEPNRSSNRAAHRRVLAESSLAANPASPSSAPAPAGVLTSAAHYENFPVASILVPGHLRPAIAAVYRFARYADDVADEGHHCPQWRLDELGRLTRSLNGGADHPMVHQLRDAIDRHSIPVRHFHELLSAFAQDAAGAQYPDQDSVLDYCSRSANPVGRIVLRIFDADHHGQLDASDAICTALQLANFYQDIGQDVARGRIYLSADQLHAHQVTSAQLQRCAQHSAIEPAVRHLLNEQIARTRTMFAQGIPLLRSVPLRLRLELATVISGGMRILRRVENEDPFAARIKLGKVDMPALLGNATRLLITNKLI